MWINIILAVVLVILIIVSYILYRKYHNDVLGTGQKPEKEDRFAPVKSDTENTQKTVIHENFDKMVENPFRKNNLAIKIDNPLFLGLEFGLGFFIVATLFLLIIYLSYRLFF